ncbi:MAG TPA: hypothetical protein VI643_05955 [Planctomycetota bacterium]|nr:hypothetical protein [Planctomycetota bacterium]
MKRLAFAGLIAFASACDLGPQTPGPHIEALKTNPTDTESMAQLAIIGRPAVAPMLAAMEEHGGLRKPVLTTLAVAGEPCWPAMVDYFDQCQSDDLRADILEVFAQKRWKGVVRKLSNRIEHASMGPYVYNTIVRILEAQNPPPDPWASGALDPVKKAEFDRWVGQNIRTMVELELRNSLYARSELEKVKRLMEEEYQRW